MANPDTPAALCGKIEGETARRSNPGILVFTTCLQLLYMNEEARTFCGQINRRRTGKTMTGVVPAEVIEICETISKMFSARSVAKDFEHFQYTRLTNGHERPVLLRGMGLPDRGGLAKSRILILLEDAAHRKENFTQNIDGHFLLTTREKTTVIYLMKGLTNKEIASRMMVCEQTIKEHIKHIMGKTKTTTRTGILSKIFIPGQDQESARLS